MHVKKLEPAPQTISSVIEIATQYNDQLPHLWNSLASAERIFAYYMIRASMPGNRIYADQTHRHSLMLIELFENLVNNKNHIKLTDLSDAQKTEFIHEVEQFLVYLHAHHGPYFFKRI